MADEWVWLCPACIYPGDDQFICGTVARDSICARCGGLGHEVFLIACQDPRRENWRYPVGFRTCNAIEPLPMIIWDTNRYYQSLGVDVRASRTELREAYQRLRGWESEWLTYVVKQLINDDIRWAYDLTPLGTFFFDEYVRRHVRRKMAEDLSHLVSTTEVELEEAEPIDLDHLMNRPFQPVLDEPEEGDEDSTTWRWGYYLWQSGCASTARLAEWQERLVEAFAERGESQTIGVGFMGAHMVRPWEVIEVGHLIIVFLNDGQHPSADLARQAVGRVASHTSERTLVHT